MNMNDVKTSKFLKKEDVGPGVLVTVARVTKENVAMEGAGEDMRVCLHFNELDKPLILNSTNGQIMANVTGHTEDIETTWADQAIVLYSDPNVSYMGKLVGGVRVRAPKPGSVPAMQEQKQTSDADLPF